MRFSVLGSGSKGNCVYIETENTAILIDGGFSGKEIAGRLARIGRDISSLEAILVTHEHHDHINGVGVVSRRCGIPVCANVGTFRGAEKKLGKVFKRVEFNTGEIFEFGDFQVRPFAVSHDTNDPVGFVISGDSQSFGYCTDTGIASRLIGQRLAGCNGLVLEFNHDPDLLKNGPYPPPLKQRISSSHGHLSNEEAAGLLECLIHDRLEHIVLAHLSETNNLPEIAYKTAVETVGDRISHRALTLSYQDYPTELLGLDG